MSSLATVLAWVELIGTVVVTALLVVALVWKRHLLTMALVTAIAFGVVFANPLGVVAKPSGENARSLTPSSESDGSRHWVKVGGVPVAWFIPYDQPYPWAGAFENSPTSVLKLRYGFSFLPSTGAATVVKQCSNYIGDPCWRDRPDDYPLVHRNAEGRAYVVPLTKTLVPSRQGESAYPSVPHVYEASLGVASWRGLAYWLVVGVVLVVSAAKFAVHWRTVGLAAAGCLVVGFALGGVIAALPESGRSASSVQPPLLPDRADAPESSGSAELMPIESYEPSCLVQTDAVVSNRCGRIDSLTASASASGILAVWTAEADGFMHLRTRRLSSSGEPLGDTSTLRSWDQSANSGGWNCAIPAELQSARLAQGNVLVAWSSTCDLRGGGGGPASITGLVLTPSGGPIDEPFQMLAYDRGLTAEPAPRYWLRATTTGEPILFWEAPTRTRYYGRALFVSRLDSQLHSTEGSEMLYGEHGIGSVGVACGAECVVAQGLSTGITFHVVGSSGRVLRKAVVLRGSAPRSELVAAARDDDYHVGWIESDGVNVDGYLASLGVAGAPLVQKVASRIPAGDGRQGVTPDPLGIALGRVPALVFQTPTIVADEFWLHVASPEATSTKSTDVRLGESSVVADVLVAIAGLWPSTPAEPVSVVVR